jgi:hypothetical protein
MNCKGRVFASLVLARHGMLSTDDIPYLTRSDEWATHFDECYGICHKFFFNKFYERGITVKYLGSHQEVIQFQSLSLKVRTDFVNLTQVKPLIDAIHLHISFPEITIDMNNETDAGISAIITVLDSLYRFNEEPSPTICPETLSQLRGTLRHVDENRDFALEVSRYLYVSIAGLPKAAITNPSESNLINMYRFLYIHDQGVNVDVARKYLGNHWYSTSFFKLYCQPGAIISLSTPFPSQAYKEHPNWFFPDHKILAKRPQEVVDYDHLPEYPPLRYLAIPALHYAAVHEESLRYSYNTLLSHFDSIMKRWNLDNLFKGVQSSLLAQNIEAVRLPITRSLITQIIQTQDQKNTIETIERLITRSMTSLQVTIAFSALAIALLAFVISIWKVFH